MQSTSYRDTLKGQFIMAMPMLADPNFSNTVTCISEHNDEGAFGLVVNRVHAMLSAKDIFEELGLEPSIDASQTPIHIGGPVHMDEVFILHGPPFHWEGCILVTETIGLSNTMDILSALAGGTGPDRFMITLGCAGWAAGQLEEELKANAWLTGPVSDSIIFDTPVNERWEDAIKGLGIDPALLSTDSGSA